LTARRREVYAAVVMRTLFRAVPADPTGRAAAFAFFFIS
jgi:hypothetical protein